MSASLRAGTYDAGVNILRTCSLPDLTSLVAHNPAHDPGSPEGDVEGPSENEEGISMGSSAQRAGIESELRDEDDDKDNVFYEESVEEGEGEEVGEEEGEVEEKGEGEEEDEGEGEEEWSSSEDEDLQQLVQTLQNFVEDASKQQLCVWSSGYYLNALCCSSPPPFLRISSPYQIPNCCI